MTSLTPSQYLPLIVLLPLLGAVFNGLLGAHVSKRTVTVVANGVVIASFGFAVAALLQLIQLRHTVGDESALTSTMWTWISSGSLTVSLSFLFDPLSCVMVLVVTGVGGLIHIFSIGYMREDKAYWRYFAYLNLFMFSMLMLVLGKNMLVLFIGWEGVGLCSYLLIGFWYDDMDKSIAGQKAFIANRVGDFGFLLAMFILLYYSHGDLDFGRLAHVVGPGGALQDPATITLICLLLFVGATGKSAQIPLYVWLPDAMAGPTPVSALIHAATMVTAGVYMMVRLNFLFSASAVAMETIAIIGAATALFASTIALVQTDIKKVLAYSTVSQIGYMVLAVGVGGFVGAIFHLMAHAFFKACLFLGSGSVIHALHHEQDVRKMGGLRKKLPITAASFLVSSLAISGIPLFAGFFSKDDILYTAFSNGWGSHSPIRIAWLLGLVAALFTAFYMARLYYLTFEGDYRGDAELYEHAHEEKVMNFPLIVLGILATIGGFIGIPEVLSFHGSLPNVLERWLGPVVAPGASHFTSHGSPHIELILMAVSVTVALTGWLAGRAMYKRSSDRLPAAPTEAFWYRTLTDKYYVDELYDMAVIRPLRLAARELYAVVDTKIIDGFFVRGTTWLVRRAGDALRPLQNGDVQAYVTAIVVGLAILLYFAM